MGVELPLCMISVHTNFLWMCCLENATMNSNVAVKSIQRLLDVFGEMFNSVIGF